MTATAKKKSAKKKRIRPELLPETAVYATIDKTEYVMIPVQDFGDWYDDTVDGAIAEERRDAAADAVPLDLVRARLKGGKRKEKGMKYQVSVTPRALKELERLDTKTQERILAAVEAFADDPRPHGSKKLKGRDTYRVRVGDYRIIYEIHDRTITVTVLRVGHRRDIYK